MKRILAYKAKVGILAGGTFGQGPNVGRNWSGLVRLEFSGRKMESRLKPGPSGRVSGPKTGQKRPKPAKRLQKLLKIGFHNWPPKPWPRK